jgi:O-antigen ligase
MVSLNKITLTKFIEIVFLNLFLFPIYPDNVKPSFVALFFITAVYAMVKKRNIFFNSTSKVTSLLLINISVFLLLLISLNYSRNITFGLKYIFRSLPLFLFPIAFFFLKEIKSIFSSKLFLKAKLYFYLSTLILFIVIFVLFYFRGFVTENYFLNYSYRIIHQLGYYSMHPIYASLITSISIIFSISLFKEKKYKLLIIVGNTLLVLNLILLSRKSAIIIMGVFFLIFVLFNKSTKVKIKVFILFITLVLFMGVVKFIPDISNRFNDFVVLFDYTNISSSNLRLNLIDVSIDAIKEKPFFGYGIGDTRDVLSDFEQKNDFFNNKYYNTHNQYLNFMLATGFLGLLLFIVFLFKNLQLAVLGSLEQFSIVLLFILLMFIENILDRQNGVIYFAVLINYFSFYNKINS